MCAFCAIVGLLRCSASVEFTACAWQVRLQTLTSAFPSTIQARGRARHPPELKQLLDAGTSNSGDIAPGLRAGLTVTWHDTR